MHQSDPMNDNDLRHLTNLADPTSAQSQELVQQHIERLKQDILSGKVQIDSGKPACMPQTTPLPPDDMVMVENNGKLSMQRVTPEAMAQYKELEAQGYTRVHMGPNRKDRRRAKALARHA